MNDATKQNLSALADAELGADEVRFLLRRVSAEPDCAQLWTRYHVAGECLRRESLLPVSAGFADRVAAALPVSGVTRTAHWLRMGVGGAIAASVAVAALVLVRPASAPTPMTQAPALAAAGTPVSAASATRPALNNYSLLMRGPGASRLNVEPASAIVSPGYVALRPADYVRDVPVWMQRGTFAAPARPGVGFGVNVGRVPAWVAQAAATAPPAQTAVKH